MTAQRRLTPEEVAEYWRANRRRWEKLDHEDATPRPAAVHIDRPGGRGVRLERMTDMRKRMRSK